MLMPTCQKYHAVQEILDSDALKCKTGYDAFRTDVERLLEMDSMDCLQGITASIWLEKIIAADVSYLADYIERYRAGWLNPFQVH